MAFVALPNPLRIPSNNPNATAERAPVPGRSQQNNNPGSLTQLSLAEDPGIGDTPIPQRIPPLPPGQPIAQNVECVGDPPHQTEDPLSPPCVPYWSGDNGGATWKGVTGQEIRVVFYNDLGVNGDMNAPYRPTDDTAAADFEHVNLVKTIKSQLRYFQRRYQTYARIVHLIAYSSGGTGSTPAQRRSDAIVTNSRFDPFAGVFLGDNAQDFFNKLAEFGVPSFGLNFDVAAKYYADNRPYVWSMTPDQETQTAWSASFICRTLLARETAADKDTPTPLARFAGDVALRAKPRKIGFITVKNSARGPAMEQESNLLIRYVMEECGYDLEENKKTYQGGTGAGSQDAGTIMADYIQKEVTTIVCYCIPVPSEVTVSTMQNAASLAQYHPEWYWDSASAMDRPIWIQAFGAKDQPSLGNTYFWRQPAFRQQQHYRAYESETRDGSVPNVRFNFNIYHLFLNLFTAIQAAGPILTPESVERGMFTFKHFNPGDPWLPTGSYGLDGPSPYTFIDTAMGWFWVPTGTPPGSHKEKEGCQRVLAEGKRFYGVGSGPGKPGWPVGDDELAKAAAGHMPCTEDTRKIEDPQPGDLH